MQDGRGDLLDRLAAGVDVGHAFLAQQRLGRAHLELAVGKGGIAAAGTALVAHDLQPLDQLFTAEIPAEVRKSQIIDGYDIAQDKVDAYCDALTTAAEPLAEQSLKAYSVCLSKSTELGWFSEWSKLCERELGQIKPEEYPSASELRATPNNVAPVIAVEPPIKRLE